MSKSRSPVLAIVRTAACREADFLSFPSMTTLHLGNLPFSATASVVRDLFEQHGPVLTVDVRGHREPRPPRGGLPERDSRR